MKDRISTYPGRVRLIPVEGQENVFDLTRADEPLQIGTPLNRNSLLKDDTALLFGLTSDAMPDDVLSKIGIMLSGNSKVYKWQKSVAEYSVRTKAHTLSMPSTVTYSSEIGANSPGVFGLIDPITVNKPSNATEMNNLLTGKYFLNNDGLTPIIKFENAASNYNYNGYYVDGTVTNTQVSSPDRNAYPDGRFDNLTYYTYLGEFEQPTIPTIELFSYIGTGTYGENNPTVFNFADKPKYLVFVDYVNSNGNYTYAADSLYGAIVVNIADLGANNMPFQYSNNYAVTIKYSNNVFYWFSTKNAVTQLNAAGYTYRG